MMGGYASSSPWKNVNRTNHATDITTNLGDLLDQSGGYISGGFSDYYAYAYGLDNLYSGSGTHTSSINMATEAGRTSSSSWDILAARSNTVTVMNSTLTVGFTTGGGYASVDRHNYVTEVMSVGTTAVISAVTGGIFGQHRGWCSTGVASSQYITFATETWSSAMGVLSWANDANTKGLSSKHGWGYGALGLLTQSLTKISDITGATLATTTKANGTSQEENFEMGQDWGYCIGLYNGTTQVNTSYKVNYLTDVATAGGSSMEPQGHTGASSGATASASSQILGGL
jgi:hypothetical protein